MNPDDMPRAAAPDRLLRVLLHWTALTTVLFWLPLVRGAFDGASYEWGLFGLRGAGTSGDYWFPALGTAFALTTLALGWRGARAPFHLLLLAWHGFLAAGSIYLALTAADEFTLRGDTLGIEFSLAYVAPVLFGGFALAAALWIVRDLRSGRGPEAPPWTRGNTVRLAALLALLPVQFVLLRFGTPVSGWSDRVGVILTIVQWLMIGWALRPRGATSGAGSSA